MKKIGLLLALTIATIYDGLSQSFMVEETEFKNDTLSLVADIYVPVRPVRAIGIAIIQGSGNNDRSNAWSKSLAQILASNGYYVLLPDKRGCGKSKGNWRTASFEDLAKDAIASLRHLKDRKKLTSVGIMGLSQGGFIAPIVAAQDAATMFCINIVGAGVRLEEQIIHEVSNTALKEGLKPNEIKEVLDLHVLYKDYAFNGNWNPLAARLVELEKGSWSSFLKTFPAKPDLWVWNWIRLNMHFDPMHYWQLVKQDVFVAYGAKDQNDNMPVFESVHAGNEGFPGVALSPD